MIADEAEARITRTIDHRSEPHPMTTQHEPADPFTVHAAIAADLNGNKLARALLSQRLGSDLTAEQAETVLALVETMERKNREQQRHVTNDTASDAGQPGADTGSFSQALTPRERGEIQPLTPDEMAQARNFPATVTVDHDAIRQQQL